MAEIPRYAHAGFDLGIHVLPPAFVQRSMALPNKFFDSSKRASGWSSAISRNGAHRCRRRGGVVALGRTGGGGGYPQRTDSPRRALQAGVAAAAAKHNAECNAESSGDWS